MRRLVVSVGMAVALVAAGGYVWTMRDAPQSGATAGDVGGPVVMRRMTQDPI